MASADEGGCPVCKQDYDHHSHYPNLAPLWKPSDTLTALRAYLENDNDPGELKTLRLKPWWPWWASIPYMNFHMSIMPNLLHQLYQGMLKTHLIAWTKKIVGVHVVDKCFRAMPGAVGLHHFTKGISRIPGSRWTGRESKEVAKQLLPLVASQLLIKPVFVSLTQLILDFTYHVHKSQMSETDIQRLEQALHNFHENKSVLVTLRIYESVEDLNRVKKLHMKTHYQHVICEMGTPDSYNTEAPEHLHIIYAKKGWHASSKVRPLPQMAMFIQRYEAIRIHHMYIDMYYGCQVRGCVESQVVYGKDEDVISKGVGLKLVNQDDETDECLLESEGLEGETEGKGGDEDPDNELNPEPEAKLVRIQSMSLNDEDVPLDPEWSIAVKPTTPRLTCDEIVGKYGAFDFMPQTNKWLQASIEAGVLP
ncbi:hypothetical protein RSAG8_12982, partial [Rhizoctonia solani AG-8 WAC10335]